MENLFAEKALVFRNFQLAPVYHQIGVTYRSVSQFPVILLNDLRAWPDDVTRPRPLRPSSLCRAMNGRRMDIAESLG